MENYNVNEILRYSFYVLLAIFLTSCQDESSPNFRIQEDLQGQWYNAGGAYLIIEEDEIEYFDGNIRRSSKVDSFNEQFNFEGCVNMYPSMDTLSNPFTGLDTDFGLISFRMFCTKKELLVSLLGLGSQYMTREEPIETYGLIDDFPMIDNNYNIDLNTSIDFASNTPCYGLESLVFYSNSGIDSVFSFRYQEINSDINTIQIPLYSVETRLSDICANQAIVQRTLEIVKLNDSTMLIGDIKYLNYWQ